MSYLSGQLKRLLGEGHTQASLADAAKISQGQFSKYVKGTSRPDRENLNRLCSVLPEKDRAELILAHLRDETPECARDLVVIASKLESSGRVREEPEIPLAPEVRKAFDFFEHAAQSDQDIADWILSAYRAMTKRKRK